MIADPSRSFKPMVPGYPQDPFFPKVLRHSGIVLLAPAVQRLVLSKSKYFPNSRSSIYQALHMEILCTWQHVYLPGFLKKTWIWGHTRKELLSEAAFTKEIYRPIRSLDYGSSPCILTWWKISAETANILKTMWRFMI